MAPRMHSKRPRLSWSHAVALFLLASGTALAACGSKEPPPPPPDPLVTQGAYCQRTGAAFCKCVGLAEAACMEAYSITCMAGKDGSAMSDRTETQTQTCEAALSQRCTTVATGQMPPECPGIAPKIPGLN